MKSIKTHWGIAIPLVALVSVLHAWFSPGLIAGDDFIPYGTAQLASYFPWRYLWDPGFHIGSSTGQLSPGFPLWILAGGLARLGFGWHVSERILWLFPFVILATLAPYILAFRLTRSSLVSACSALIFCLNTWTLSLVQRGHIPSLVAYAMVPLLVFLVLDVFQRRRWWHAPVFSLTLSAQVMYDLRYSYIALSVIALLCLVKILGTASERVLTTVRRFAAFFAVSGSIFIVLNLRWLLPQLVTATDFPPGYDSLDAFLGDSSQLTLAHAATLFYPFFHYVQGTPPFLRDAVDGLFFILPAILLYCLALSVNKPLPRALAVVALLAIVLVSGPMSPLGAISRWAFLHVPGMKMFRDITKWYAALAFAYAMLAALSLNRLGALFRLTKQPAILNRSVLAMVICAIQLVAMRDAWNPQRFSNFSVSSARAEDKDLQDYLDRQPGIFKTVVFPQITGSIAPSDAHAVVSGGWLSTWQPPYGLADESPDIDDALEFYKSPLASIAAHQMNIGYVAVLDDPLGTMYRPWAFRIEHAHALSVFRHISWLRMEHRFGNIVLFRVVDEGRPAFVAPTTVVLANQGPTARASALTGLIGTNEPWLPLADARRPPSSNRLVEGAFLLDSDYRKYQGSFEVRRTMMRAVERQYSSAKSFPFYAFSRYSTTLALAHWSEPLTLDATFQIATQATLQVTAALASRDNAIGFYPVRLSQGRLNKIVRSSEIVTDDGVTTDLINDGGSIEPGSQVPVSNDHVWFKFDSTHTFLTVVSPSFQDQAAKLQFNGLVSVGSSNCVLGVAGSTRGSLPSRELARKFRGARPFVADVLLHPGLNKIPLRLEGCNAKHVLISDDIDVTVLQVRKSREIDRRFRGELFVPPPLSLENNPFMQIYADAQPSDPQATHILFDFVDEDGYCHEVATAVAFRHRGNYAINVKDVVDRALHPATRTETHHKFWVDSSTWRLRSIGVTSDRTLTPPHLRVALWAEGQDVSALQYSYGVDLRGARSHGIRFRYSSATQLCGTLDGRSPDSVVEIPLNDSAESLQFDVSVPRNAVLTGILRSTSGETGLAGLWSPGIPESLLCGNGERYPGETAGEPVDLAVVRKDAQDGVRYTIRFPKMKVRTDYSLILHLSSDGKPSGSSPFIIGNVVALSHGTALTRADQNVEIDKHSLSLGQGFAAGLDPGKGMVRLAAGTHRVRTVIRDGKNVEAVAIGPRRNTELPTPIKIHELSPVEFVSAMPQRNGMFVWANGYSSGWHAYRIPSSDRISGNPLIDFVRFRFAAIPASRHYRLDELLNGWDVPAPNTQRFDRLLLLYTPECAAMFGAAATVIVCVIALAVFGFVRLARKVCS